MSDNTNCPHYTSKMECDSCGHDWVAVHPVTGDDCISLECPNCGHENWITLIDPRPVHLVISNIDGATYIKPNRHVPVWRVKTMLKTAMEMVESAGTNVVIDPTECSLRVILSVDEEQEFTSN